ncbi:MAG: hypothetical protein IJK02_01640 [Clostridia bacterium]|nr:hypothetical protein [Clostridia bacterium]
MPFERVVYYGLDDMFYGLGLRKIETLVIPDYQSIGINDAIEFYQIYKYLHEGARIKTWSDEEFDFYSKKSRRLFGLTNRYINSLNDSNIVDEYNCMDELYNSAFWELFENNKLFNKISSDEFERIINTQKVSISCIFEKEQIVKHYGSVLRRYILNNSACVSLLLRYYEQNAIEGTKIYLPNELTGQEYVAALDAYLDSKHVNANMAKRMYYMRPRDQFPISDSLRLKARKKYEDEFKSPSSNSVTIANSISVSISNDQKEEKTVSIDGGNIIASYSRQWLIETLDYPSILNNFIYIFDFADFQQMRCSHICTKNMGGVFEKAFSFEAKYYYPAYYSFKQVNALAMLQMQSYYDFLFENGVRFENVLQWFFTDYIKQEFGCPAMRLTMPSEHATLLEKCVSICTAIEMAIKQFSQYAKMHTIDFELLEISSSSLKLDQIPSLVDKKHIYGKGNSFKYYIHHLFSDQSTLPHAPRFLNKKYKCFKDLVKKENVNISDYKEREQDTIKRLSDADLIRIADDGSLSVGNLHKLHILFDLYQHEAINRWHYSDEFQHIFQEWIDAEVLFEESSLLTRQESDYFSYLLNYEKFYNGFGLRNIYAHGNGQLITDENEHKQNYNILIRLMTLLTIKINDDFCLYQALKEGDQ